MNTVFGNVPLGACLAYQLQDCGRPNTTFVSNFIRVIVPTDNSALPCVEFPDIPIVRADMTPFDLNELQVLDQTDLIDFFVDHSYRFERSSCFGEENSLAG